MTDGAALRSTAWVLSGLSVWALSLADYVAHRGRKIEHLSDEDPLELGLFIIGACALMWAAPLAQLAGWRLRKDEGFKLIQFFAGGLPSVLIQAFAWSCYATAVFASVMSLLNPSVRLKGLKTGLSLLGVAAQALVNVSVDLFEAPVQSNHRDSKGKLSDKNRWSLFTVCASSLSFTTTLAGLTICLLAEVGFIEEYHRSTMWNVAMGCFTVATFSVSVARLPETTTAQSEVIQVAQLFSWLLYGAAVWIYLRLGTTPSYAALRGSTVGLGIVGSVSSILSLYALLWAPEISHQYNPPVTQIHQPSAAAHTSIIYRLSLGLLLLSLISRFYSTTLAAIMSIVGAPLAHLGAWLVFRLDDGFHLVRALQGGATFSVFQGVGWMAYAIALLGVFVFAVSSDMDFEAWGRPTWDDAGDFLHPIVFIAHISLLWSKQVFRRVVRLEPSKQSTRPPLVSTDADSPSRPQTGKQIQPDDVVPTTPVNSRDVASESLSNDQIPGQTEGERSGFSYLFGRSLVGKLSLAFIILSLGSQYLLPIFPQVSIMISIAAAVLLVAQTPAPFTGTAPIVVQQALGWTLFTASLVAQFVLLYNKKRWIEYDSIASLVRAFGLIVLVTTQTASSPKKSLLNTPSGRSRSGSSLSSPSTSTRRRRKTDEEMSMDLRELDSLMDQAKRPAVLTVLEEARKMLLEGKKKRRRSAVLLGLSCIISVHINVGLTFYVDWIRQDATSRQWNQVLFGLDIFLWALNAAFIHLILGVTLWGAEGYRLYQPFRGGLYHVVLQALGWALLVIFTIAKVVSFNYGISKIELDGLLSGLGLGTYTGAVLLLASFARFDADAPHLGFAFDLGWFLSAGALILFLGVDLAIVRFGLQDASLLVPVIVCAWVALALSVPLAYVLEQRADEHTRRSRFGVIRVAALAVWTFSLFLTLVLIGRAATLSSSVWLSSKTGMASVVAQGMMAISSDTARAALVTQQLAFLLMTGYFLYLVMPTVRLFLDGPMWYYAYFFKTWRHSRSPDGKHPLDRTKIWRNVSFGGENMDVLVPMNEAENEEEEKVVSVLPRVSFDDTDDDQQEDEHPPVVYMHGGGHIFVKREVLAHQVTPLCRAGVVVYSVEYPLSPESRFPAAVVCVLQALKWIKEFHCRGGGCVAGKTPQICGSCKDKQLEHFPVDFPCRCCPHRRGANVVQLLGDSAGGNLAALATALLTNPTILETLSPHSGHDDFPSWVLPKVQRLCVVYGLLGRKLDDSDDEDVQVGGPTWTEWVIKSGSESVIRFVLNEYAGPNLPSPLKDKVVLNDLHKSLDDFAPETLLLCGTYDPLVATNRQALKLIRQQTGRECRLVEYPGSIHGFAGWPIQWSMGRWLKDAYPATCEMVTFFTGGKQKVPDVELSDIPMDYTPLVIFPLSILGMGFILRIFWSIAALVVNFISMSIV